MNFKMQKSEQKLKFTSKFCLNANFIGNVGGSQNTPKF